MGSPIEYGTLIKRHPKRDPHLENCPWGYGVGLLVFRVEGTGQLTLADLISCARWPSILDPCFQWWFIVYGSRAPTFKGHFVLKVRYLGSGEP